MELINNLVDNILECEVKLGYFNESMNLYYPEQSLKELLHCDGEGLQRAIEDFVVCYEDRLGKLSISKSGTGRYKVTIPASGVEWVHENYRPTEFIKEFLKEIKRPGNTIVGISGIFGKYSKSYTLKQVGEKEWAISFDGQEPDPYVYHIEQNDFGLEYHRFTRQAYRKLYAPTIILASGSPRRRDILKQAGFGFEVLLPKCNEETEEKNPERVCTLLAERKAGDVARQLKERATGDNLLIISADTIVVLEDKILGKPEDRQEAKKMLTSLSGKIHSVLTGVCMLTLQNGSIETKSFCCESKVRLYPISEEDIDEYIESGDPMDKAGAYGIQGGFAKHVEGIEGSYQNIVGLPIEKIYQEMKKNCILW